jgi:hypothetical protein
MNIPGVQSIPQIVHVPIATHAPVAVTDSAIQMMATLSSMLQKGIDSTNVDAKDLEFARQKALDDEYLSHFVNHKYVLNTTNKNFKSAILTLKSLKDEDDVKNSVHYVAKLSIIKAGTTVVDYVAENISFTIIANSVPCLQFHLHDAFDRKFAMELYFGDNGAISGTVNDMSKDATENLVVGNIAPVRK